MKQLLAVLLIAARVFTLDAPYVAAWLAGKATDPIRRAARRLALRRPLPPAPARP